MKSFLIFFFFFNDTATTEIYTTRHTFPYTTLFRSSSGCALIRSSVANILSASTPLRMVSRSEEHTSELQSRLVISYAVCCLKKKMRRAAERDPLDARGRGLRAARRLLVEEDGDHAALHNKALSRPKRGSSD